MTNKPRDTLRPPKSRPSEADHDRNTPGGEKGLAESGVNQPHIEPAEDGSPGKSKT